MLLRTKKDKKSYKKRKFCHIFKKEFDKAFSEKFNEDQNYQKVAKYFDKV